MTTRPGSEPRVVMPTARGGLGWRLQTPAGLLCLFAIGLAIRLILARYSNGLAFDVGLFREWSDRLAQGGPGHFYAPGYFADYPPGYLYVLLALGRVSRALWGGPPPVALLKLPAIVADLGVALLAALLAVRITRREPAGRGAIRALAAGAILFNPGLILVSAVWGQVDSVLALLVLAGIYALATERPNLAREALGIALLAVAVATKPQAVLALPLVAVVLARPPAGGGPAWRAGLTLGFRAVLLAALAVAVVLALFAPFGLEPADVPRFYRDAGSVYPFTSLWAFNLWGAVGFYRPDAGSGALSLGGVSAYHLGLVAFALATVALMARGWRSLVRRVPPAAVATFGAVAVTCAAFALLTRMHERYLYLAVAGLAPFMAYHRLRRALLVLSLCFLLNLHFVYVYFSRHSSPPGDAWTIQPLYGALFGWGSDAWQLRVLAIVTAAACLSVAGLGWGWLDRRGGHYHHADAALSR